MIWESPTEKLQEFPLKIEVAKHMNTKHSQFQTPNPIKLQ